MSGWILSVWDLMGYKRKIRCTNLSRSFTVRMLLYQAVENHLTVLDKEVIILGSCFFKKVMAQSVSCCDSGAEG